MLSVESQLLHGKCPSVHAFARGGICYHCGPLMGVVSSALADMVTWDGLSLCQRTQMQKAQTVIEEVGQGKGPAHITPRVNGTGRCQRPAEHIQESLCGPGLASWSVPHEVAQAPPSKDPVNDAAYPVMKGSTIMRHRIVNDHGGA